MSKFAAVCLLFALCFAGCGEDKPEGDYSVSAITIHNIPLQIPVRYNETEKNDTFKVYLLASNSMNPDDLPVAKGLVTVTPDMLVDGTSYTVTIDLQKPNAKRGDDPNLPTGPWSGTASFFSIVISPKPADKVEDIWVKAGMTLNKGKENMDWGGSGLLDSRSSGSLITPKQVDALYKEVVSLDPEITAP